MEIMSKIISNFIIDKYSVIKVDEIPTKPYNKIKIGNDFFKPVPIFDAKNCIAIESNKKFISENIEFIKE